VDETGSESNFVSSVVWLGNCTFFTQKINVISFTLGISLRVI
jgi:hypothetical protein